VQDGTNISLSPELNAGTVALQYFFAQLDEVKGREQMLVSTRRFVSLYESMFGDPWKRAQTVEPLIPPDLSQPSMVLPFQEGKLWCLTAGPHPAWELSEPLAALDFAPASTEPGCTNSKAWVVSAADGLVVRSEFSLVVQDLDGDGHEQTGWVIIYMHIESLDQIPPGTQLHTDDIIGHPSCNRGRATGTHVHIARKYNGEWIPVGGSVPFVLSEWVAHNGLKPFQGTMTKNPQLIRSNQYGTFECQIIR
jgi:LasA protease